MVAGRRSGRNGSMVEIFNQSSWEKAAELLSRPIEIVSDELNTAEIPPEESETNGTIDSLKLLKISALINLMKADGKIAQQETTYLETLIANALFDADTVAHLREQMVTEGKIPYLL